ncbi:MAG: hypothetical protein ABI740_02130 [Alphaproteobacteria bacterium]
MTAVYLDADGDPLPETLQLRPARLKWLIIFLISAGFVAAAVWLGPGDEPLTIWASGGFFALCAIIALPQMLGVGARLTLDLDGFTCKTLLNSFRCKWRDCGEFGVVSQGLRSVVGFDLMTAEAASPRLATIARGLTGYSGGLADNYGISPHNLADLMNRFRARALGLMETR